MVSQQLLHELQLIFEEDYGLKLQPKQVEEVANTLVTFYGTLIKIDEQDEKEQENEPDNEQ